MEMFSALTSFNAVERPEAFNHPHYLFHENGTLNEIESNCLALGRPDSVVGITTGYGLDGSGIESRLGEVLRTCPDRPWDPPSLLYIGYRVFIRGKERPGRDADPSPASSAVVMKG